MLPRPRAKEFNALWRVERDGSLRGDDTAEYVTVAPMSREGIKNALDVLDAFYVKNQSVVNESIRAGVHVHLNVQHKTPLELMTFITTYYIMENYFVHWCGKGRIGNHFCLRAEDAEYLVNQFLKVGQTRDWRHLNTEEIRYSALNLLSLFKYGSVEFRTMQGTRDLNKIMTWVDMIDQLDKASAQFKNPVDVIHALSDMNGPERFAREIMGDLFKEFESLNVDIIRSMRIIQPMAMMTDWDVFSKKKVNPFL